VREEGEQLPPRETLVWIISVYPGPRTPLRKGCRSFELLGRRLEGKGGVGKRNPEGGGGGVGRIDDAMLVEMTALQKKTKKNLGNSLLLKGANCSPIRPLDREKEGGGEEKKKGYLKESREKKKRRGGENKERSGVITAKNRLGTSPEKRGKDSISSAAYLAVPNLVEGKRGGAGGVWG